MRKIKNWYHFVVALASVVWFRYPAKKLIVIGVTGTDGKTTTATLIYHLLNKAGKKVALVSTVAAYIGDKQIDTGFHVTSPDPWKLQMLIREIVNQNYKYLVLEATSHGLDQHRLLGTNTKIAVLTNITHEHLDYHKTYKKYLKAKAKLFKNVKVAILNSTDNSYKAVRRLIKSQTKVIAYDRKTLANNLLKVIQARFPESYNQLNATAAILAVFELGIKEKSLIKFLGSFPGVPGRMEEIKNRKGIKIVIDFAHTPNALQSVLTELKKQAQGRLICVLGCAGARDELKRPMMAKIATTIADLSIFTAEDPRNEDINHIIKQMKKGIKSNDSNYRIVKERGEAIYQAIKKHAKKDDTVVICGKGHEKSMCYEDIEHPWSDHEAVEKALSAKEDLVAIVLAAGRGTRLNSEKPKVIHKIAGRPMISYTLENLRGALFGKIVVVVGYKKNEVMKVIDGSVDFAYQKKAMGTAHAVRMGLARVPENCNSIVVLNGDDSAFYSPETILNVIAHHKKTKAVLTFVSLIKDDPSGLGRVKRNTRGKVVAIIEEKDASPRERKIKEVNDGLYVFDCKWLRDNLTKIKKSESGEYYLVSLVGLAVKNNKKVEVYKLEDPSEWMGVNTPQQLVDADQAMRKKVKDKLVVK